MKSVRVGKAKVCIYVEDCFTCGAELDADSYPAGKMFVRVGTYAVRIGLWNCEKCHKSQEKKTVRPTLAGLN